MAQGGQQQTVASKVLEQKVGHLLIIGEEFETASGRWKVVDIGRYGEDTYTIEMIIL